MNRNPDLFPHDENGDVLWRMHSSGDNLSQSREFDFIVVFPSEHAAVDFAVVFLRRGFKVSFSPSEVEAGFPWQVGVHPVFAPSHKDVTGFEAELEAVANKAGGKNDGWGCYEVT